MKLGANINSFTRLNSFTVTKATGKDAGDFLHRMSTNSVSVLKLGEVCLNAFLNQKGRLVSLCYVIHNEPGSYLLVVPYGCDLKLDEWLDQFLFSEDVKLENQNGQYDLFWCIGPNKAGFNGPIFSGRQGKIHTSFLLAPRSEVIPDILKDANQVSSSEFEALRISGICPFSKNEINLNHQPIQLGLIQAISWTKGCYIGQEVISRLESKSKTAVTLFGMSVSKKNWEKLVEGEDILLDSKPAGTLTSKAPIYIAEQPNALFVLKRNYENGKLMTDFSKVGIDSHYLAD